jgi:hypothetical protein
MSDPRHRELADRWWTMTVAEQLGNIGSEISRTANEYGSTAASLQHYFDAFAACRPRT